MASKPEIPNVRWRGEWAWGRTTYKGKEHTDPLETKDPRVARERVQKWLANLKSTNWGEKPRRTYDEAASKFIDEHLPLLKGGIEGRTAKGYLKSLALLTDALEGKYLDDIGSALLSEFEQSRRKDGVTDGTIRGDLFVLSSLFTRAQGWEWVAGNPVAAYLRTRNKQKLLVPQPPRTRYCSHEEEQTIIERCRNSKTSRDGSTEVDHIMLAAGIILTIDIGLRSQELLQADWTSVDLVANEWTVPREIAKSKRPRVIPILPRSQKLLKALPRSSTTTSVLWHSERGADRRYTDLLPALLTIASGGRWRYIHNATYLAHKAAKAGGPAVTDKVLARIAAEADAQAWADPIPDLIWHDLRRTCGCRLLQDHKLPIEQVSRWLGHSSTQITERAYAFLDVRHLHASVGTGPALIGVEAPQTVGTNLGQLVDLDLQKTDEK